VSPASKIRERESKQKTSLKAGDLATTSSAKPAKIYIRVPRGLLLPIPATTPGPAAGPPPGPSPDPLPGPSPGPDPDPSPDPPPADHSTDLHLYVIEGIFEEIARYAGTTADWIIKVARLICNPLGGGQVYTYTTGTPDDWYASARTPSWREVVQGDPLRPGIYEFFSATPVTLTKINERRSHSRTSLASAFNATRFRRIIGRRDGDLCILSKSPVTLKASHLIPKRMGTNGAIEAVTRFSGEQAALGIDCFDPRIGVLLFATLDELVDSYRLGFYHVTVSYHIEFGIMLFNTSAL
jgi:hypothetical protein